MGFVKIVLAVVIGNLATLAIVFLLAVLSLGSGLNTLSTKLGLDLPQIDITFADTPVWSNAPPTKPAQSKVASAPQKTTPITTKPSPSLKPEPERNNAAIKSARQMCQFWDKEYRKDRAEQSKNYRSQACNRFERLSGESRNQIVSAVPSISSQDHANNILAARQAERDQEQRERNAHTQTCDRIKRRMEVIQAQLRDGYAVSEGNRLRGERRELSYRYSTECLLGR